VVINSNSIIAAGAVVTKGTVVESGTVYGGAPAKKIKEMSPDLLHGEIERIARNYELYSSWYKDKSENLPGSIF
jgi:carbonic anhydrase/acetyltransferase-like protein (isoleucine patch superfamily)